MPASIAHVLAESRVWLAPMEDVSDAVFRRICRSVGARVCVTEFVRAEATAVGRPGPTGVELRRQGEALGDLQQSGYLVDPEQKRGLRPTMP